MQHYNGEATFGGANTKNTNLHINLRVAVYQQQMTSIRFRSPQERPPQEKKNKPAEAGLFLYMLVNNYF